MHAYSLRFQKSGYPYDLEERYSKFKNPKVIVLMLKNFLWNFGMDLRNAEMDS